MPFTVSIERNAQYVRYNVVGPPSLKNYFDLIEQAAKETRESNLARVMVDLRGVTGRLSFTDQFFIGEVVGDKLAHVAKLASLVRDDPESYNSPKVAQRKGVDLRSFSGEEEAIAWLTAPADGA
ncbi:MAG TPA: hypothetical protein VMZ74_12820 [Ramlibacter sp.]|nr:hypothetical protein [Ramlibacter sp.]